MSILHSRFPRLAQVASSCGAIALLVGGIGLTGLATTDVRVASTGILDGGYQRVYEQRFEQNLPMRAFAIEAWNALTFGLLGHGAQGAVIGRDGWMFTVEVFAEPEAPVDFATELATASAILAKAGATLVPVIVPDKARIMADKLPRARSDKFNARYDAVLAVVAARGLPVIDLRPALTQAAPGFMRTDTHWSPDGARAAAFAVAQALADLPLERSEFATTAGASVPLEGDLTSFARTGRFEAFVGPARETLARYDTRAVSQDMGLFGETTLDAALVGTSFSARPEFHFDGFLKEALSMDLLNLAVEGQGPFEPMRAYLAQTQTFPKLVLWEIPERYIATSATLNRSLK
jgi:alginate O-acetyltransferase complex protein AlgJ